MRIPLLGPPAENLSITVNPAQCINFYLVPTRGVASPYAAYGSPGTSLFSTTGISPSASVYHRGSHVFNGIPYFVIGSSLVSINSSGAVTNHGTISGSGRVCIQDDKKNEQMVIVTGDGGAGYVFTTSLSQITDGDFLGADTVDYEDGYFLFTRSNKFFVSDLGDATSYDATYRAAINDIAVTVKAIHEEAFVFGQKRIFVYFNSGNVDFPWEPNKSATIERGLAARHSLVKEDNTLFFLGDDRIIYRLNGYTPMKISTLNEDKKISDATKIDDAFAFTYTDHGHKFYQITFPSDRLTFVYDIATGAWHEKRYKDQTRHLAESYAYAYGKHLVGHFQNANIYEMSRSHYDDAGDYMRSSIRSVIISNEDNMMRWRKIKWIMESGVGLVSGQGSDPVMMVKWSDDHGRTYKSERFIKFGGLGEYTKTIQTRNCGSSRARIIDIAITDPVKRVIADCYADIS